MNGTIDVTGGTYAPGNFGLTMTAPTNAWSAYNAISFMYMSSANHPTTHSRVHLLPASRSSLAPGTGI